MSAATTSPMPTQIPWRLSRSHEVKQGFLLTGLTLLGVVGGFVAGAYELPWLQNSLWGLAFLAGGVPSAIKALRSLLQERKLDVDLLMVVAALGAASVGQAGDGAILLFLFSLSNALQSWAMNRTRRAIEALMTLHPEGANVLCRMAESYGSRWMPYCQATSWWCARVSALPPTALCWKATPT